MYCPQLILFKVICFLQIILLSSCLCQARISTLAETLNYDTSLAAHLKGAKEKNYLIATVCGW